MAEHRRGEPDAGTEAEARHGAVGQAAPAEALGAASARPPQIAALSRALADRPPAQRAAAVLALQRGGGNHAATRMLAPARPGRRMLALQRVQTISGRYVGDLEGAEANVREDVLGVMRRLNHIWSIPNDVYAAERAVVEAEPANGRIAPASIPQTIAALRRNEEQSIHNAPARTLLGAELNAPVAAGAANAKADVLCVQDALHANWNVTTGDYRRERPLIEAGPDPVNNADIAAVLAGIARFKQAYVGGTSRRHGPLAGTGAVTAQQVADRDAALITPGTQTTTTTVGGVTVTRRAGFQDVVRVGTRDVDYRTDLWEAMDRWVTRAYADSRAMLARPRIGGGAPGDVSAFEPIGDAAKQAVDAAFGTYGQFGPRFHSGRNLLDASQRAGDAADMINYLVDNQAELRPVRARHNADHSAGQPARTIADQFKRDYVAHGNNAERLRVIDQAWPALNAGGIVSIQPFEGTTARATRRVRWEAFQTMIHEYFHSLNHPNYYRYADQLGGDERSVLVEGGCSLMTDHAWDVIAPRIRSDAGLRAAVEGRAAAYDAGVIPPIANAHYEQIGQARDIETAFGRQNFQAAFLTGRMELIGYDRVAPGSAGSAAGTQVFHVPPRGVRTLADVAYRTQTSVEELARLNGLAPNAALRAGQRLIVRGAP